MAFGCLVGSANTAYALDQDEQTPPESVTSDGSAVTATLIRIGDDTRVAGVASGGSGSSNYNEEFGCYYSAVRVSAEIASLAEFGPPPTEDAVPYRILCGGALYASIWITPADIVDYDDIARGEAERYVETVLGPGLELRHAPDAYAVTGAASHHWVTGWDGAAIAVPPINPFGDQLDITLTLESVSWNFGDGSPATPDDLGSPAPSSVQHVYTHRSTESDPDGSYTVGATVTVGVTYTINGGPTITVTPPLSTELTAPVIVRELQAVLE
jgi:hypothetical protein